MHLISLSIQKEDKKIEALKSKKQWLKELPTPRETYNAWQREADVSVVENNCR